MGFRGGNAGPGRGVRQGAEGTAWEGGTTSDSYGRVVSADARPAGYVSLEPKRPHPAPQQCPSRARKKRPTSRVQRRDPAPPGVPGSHAPVSAKYCEPYREGPASGTVAGSLPEVYSQLTGRKLAAERSGSGLISMTPKGKVLDPTPQPQSQSGPDFGPLTRSPAPRARSITATAAAAPVNNTPHPLRTGTSGVRHLTSGGAGQGGVDGTKFVLRAAISRSLRGPVRTQPRGATGVTCGHDQEGNPPHLLVTVVESLLYAPPGLRLSKCLEDGAFRGRSHLEGGTGASNSRTLRQA